MTPAERKLLTLVPTWKRQGGIIPVRFDPGNLIAPSGHVVRRFQKEDVESLAPEIEGGSSYPPPPTPQCADTMTLVTSGMIGPCLYHSGGSPVPWPYVQWDVSGLNGSITVAGSGGNLSGILGYATPYASGGFDCGVRSPLGDPVEIPVGIVCVDGVYQLSISITYTPPFTGTAALWTFGNVINGVVGAAEPDDQSCAPDYDTLSGKGGCDATFTLSP